MVEGGCGQDNRYLYTVDAVYYFGNSNLCQAGCPCNANRTLWASMFPNVAAKRINIGPDDSSDLYLTSVMVSNDTVPDLATNF